ncbi:MAG: 50S ribosomal protein L6 [Desulfobacteraceae bacterium IS3]|nr:MAG: 50S ribosomal protein L6 [Desulfobacteraceae bacterium IS3]
MSRVGKKPIPIPANTKVLYKDRLLTAEGDKGSLCRDIHPSVNLKIEDRFVNVVMAEDSRTAHAVQGLTRSLVSNMITGVSKGFERILEVNGIGYRVELSGRTLVLHLGYSNPVHFELPEGISAAVEKNNILKLSGIDKEKLGLTAASIRRLRPPEPYKGKGVKYAEEYIRRKAGKTGTK